MFMKPFSPVFSFIILTALLLVSCGGSGGPTSTVTPDVAGTSAALTVLAHSSQFKTAGPTNPPVKLVTATPLTQVPYTAVPGAPTSAAPSLCDRVEFVTDVTIPDNTSIPGGAGFTKTWRLRNGGTCTWTTGYKLVFDHGDVLGGPAEISLNNTVNPGGTVDLPVNLVAPNSNGTYQGYWMLKNNSGAKFGLGSAANLAFWVKIVVENSGSATFAVTSVSISVDNAAYSGSCTTPHAFAFTATITTNGAGSVTYRWLRSDGAPVSAETIDFNAAGTQTISTVWSLGSPGYTFTGWRQMYIDQPNHQEFGKAEITITCSP